MRTAIVIPARYASTRLRGKPLLKLTGKYLVQHVYENAARARCADVVIVATDDPRIEAGCATFGGKCVMTRRDHPSGTDRVAEVARQLDHDIIVNLQGDEPETNPDHLDLLVKLLIENPDVPMATLSTPIKTPDIWERPHVVKVVRDSQGRALYFSRSPVPFVRDGSPNFAASPPQFLQHLGIYAYRREFLLELAKLPPDPLEGLEKLEQLRVLGAGRPIQVGVVAAAGRGVDTYEDYEQFRHEFAARRAIAA